LTEAGDWAFRFAFDLARKHDANLHIFFFPTPPCSQHARRGRRGEGTEVSYADAVEIERRVRLYYDDLLEDYVKVGFRLCLGDEAPELRRCLMDREYDVLVLPYECPGCPFGERTIEEFSVRMQCPVVLVGPTRREELYLNDPARLWVDDLGLGGRGWKVVVKGPMAPEADAAETPEIRRGAVADDIMLDPEWLTILRQLNQNTGLNAFSWDRRGTRRAVHDRWCNHLCPVIQADDHARQHLCAEPEAALEAELRSNPTPIADRCPAGFLRVHAPVFEGDRYAGSIGGCGGLLEGEEVRVGCIADASGLSRQAVTALAKQIPQFSRGAIETLSSWLQAQVTRSLTRIVESRQANRATA
jgi:hypothetical protein